MKVLVAVKRVVDHNVRVRIAEGGSALETQGVKQGINPFDEHALEEAVRLKEAGVATEVVAVSVGEAVNQDVLRHALALGADRAVLVDAPAALSNLAYAKVLGRVYEKEQPKLVLLGKQAIDDDASEVAQMLAAKLGLAQAAAASKITVQSDANVLVTTEIDGGQQDQLIQLPAVISADLRLNDPRYIKLPNLMMAKKKPIETLSLSDLSVEISTSLTSVGYQEPPAREAGKKLADIHELVQVLKSRLEV